MGRGCSQVTSRRARTPDVLVRVAWRDDVRVSFAQGALMGLCRILERVLSCRARVLELDDQPFGCCKALPAFAGMTSV